MTPHWIRKKLQKLVSAFVGQPLPLSPPAPHPKDVASSGTPALNFFKLSCNGPPQRRCVFGDPGAQLFQVELQRPTPKTMRFWGPRTRRRQNLAQIQGASSVYSQLLKSFVYKGFFMAIFFVLISGALVALSNLMMRKGIDSGGTAKGYLVFMMLTAFGSAVFLEPVSRGNYAWNGPIALLGAIAGSILAFMLQFLGKALEKGPPGLTFSLLSSSTVMPAILMAFLFGSSYGFTYTPWHAIGSLFVVAGIFWAGRGTSGLQDRNRWIFFSIAMFILHVCAKQAWLN